MSRYREEIKRRLWNLAKMIDEFSCESGDGAFLDRIREECHHLKEAIAREMRLHYIEELLYSSPRSLSKTLHHISTIIKNEFEFSRFDIVLVDATLKRVMRRYAQGGFGEADFHKLSKHGALTVTRDYSLSHRTPWIVNDIKKQDPNWKLALELDVWVHGTFPLYAGDELVGYLHGARNSKQFQFGKILAPEEVEDLVRLGKAITKAIVEAKSFEFERSILKIEDAIGSVRVDEKIEKQDVFPLESVMSTIVETLNAQWGGIVTTQKDFIIPSFFVSDKGKIVEKDEIFISPRPLTGIVSRALFDGYTAIENEVQLNLEKLDINFQGVGKIHTLIAVPLIESYAEEGIVRKNVIGSIILINKKDERDKVIVTDYKDSEGGFGTLDRQVLESISPHIETVISNTASHRQLRKLSITDGLTGLANHSYFMNNLLNLEFQRAKRYGTPLSVLLMDIDYFKVFNDIFGHQVGDLVLQECGRILKENTRSVDHIARYGGEEFAVILHNTHLKDGIRYAEKIRRKVEEGNYVEKIKKDRLFNIDEAKKRFTAILLTDDKKIRDAKITIMKNHFNLDVEKVLSLINKGCLKEAEDIILNSFRVTLSIGLAFYPDPRITCTKDLVITADMLLLRAKEKGRNRIEAMEV